MIFPGGVPPPGPPWLRPLAARGALPPGPPRACMQMWFLAPAARKMSISQIADLRPGSFVGDRDYYKDSNAPTLVKIGGILIIVFEV